MAEALTAQGIGFSGAPREYTGIIMARQKQQQAEDAKQKAAIDKKFEDLYKGIDIENRGQFFSFDYKDIMRESAMLADELAKARDAGDYQSAMKAKQNFITRVGARAQEKSEFEKLRTAYNQKQVVLDPEIFDLIEGSQDRVEATEKVKGRIGVVAGADGMFRFAGNRYVDEGNIFDDVAKNDMNYSFTGKTTQVQMPNGTIQVVQERVIDTERAKKDLQKKLDDPVVFAGIRDNYLLRNRGANFATPEELDLAVRNDFVRRGLELLKPEDKRRDYRGKGGMNFSFGFGQPNATPSLTMPGEEEAVTVVDVKDAQDKTVEGTERTGKIAQGPVFGITGTGGPAEAIVASGGRLINVNTNEVMSTGGTVKITFSQASPVMVNASKYPLIVYKEYEKNDKGLIVGKGQPIATYKPGSMILKEDLPFIHPNYSSFVKTKISSPVIAERTGMPETSERYLIDMENFAQASLKASAQDKPAFDAEIKKGLDMAKKWDASERKLIGSGLKRNSAAPSKPATGTKGTAKKVNVKSFFESK